MRFNLFALAFAFLVSACAGVDMAQERAAIDAQVEERTALRASPVLPPEGAVLGMDAAAALALANNRALAADLAGAALARADWAAASRPPNPLLEIAWLPHGDEPDVYDIDLAASVLGLAATPWRQAAARRRYDAAQAAAVLAAIDFAAEVRIAWIDAVAAAQRAELQDTIAEAARASLIVAEEIHAAGNSPRLDLVREQAFAQQAEIDAMTARLDAAQARLSLLSLLGLEPDAAIALPGRLDDVPALPGGGAEAEALAASLPLDRARAEVEAAAREAGLENWNSLLEHAEIGGVWEREDGAWSEGLALETALPVFDLGHPRRAAARIRAQQAADRHAQLELDTRSGIRRARLTVETAGLRAARVRDEVLPTTAQVLDETLRQYNAMQIGAFELIAAFRMRVQAGQSHVDALAEAHRARVRLDQLRAGGSPSPAVAAAAEGAGVQPAEGGH